MQGRRETLRGWLQGATIKKATGIHNGCDPPAIVPGRGKVNGLVNGVNHKKKGGNRRGHNQRRFPPARGEPDAHPLTPCRESSGKIGTRGGNSGGNSLAPGALKSAKAGQATRSSLSGLPTRMPRSTAWSTLLITKKGGVDRQRVARELRPLPPHLPDASRRLSRLWGVSRQEACQSPPIFFLVEPRWNPERKKDSWHYPQVLVFSGAGEGT